MKRKNFAPKEISRFLRDIDEAHSQGMTIAEACAAVGISQQSYYRHKAIKSKPRETQSKPVETEDYKTLALHLMKQLLEAGIVPKAIKNQ